MPAERQEKMRKYIIAHGSAQTKELASLCSVSEATVRRDLDDIARTGQFYRTHGGIMAYSNNTTFDLAHDEKISLRAAEKARIGEYAATFVKDGDTILLDSGTTSYALARLLEDKHQITVITNDLFIAMNISLHPSSSLVVLPGMRVDSTKVTVGYYAEEFMRQLRVNRYFMTTDAVDISAGTTNANVLEVGVKKAMAEAAQEKILIADSSKFNKKALFSIARVEDIDLIITDTGLDKDTCQKYQKKTKIVLV